MPRVRPRVARRCGPRALSLRLPAIAIALCALATSPGAALADTTPGTTTTLDATTSPSTVLSTTATTLPATTATTAETTGALTDATTPATTTTLATTTEATPTPVAPALQGPACAGAGMLLLLLPHKPPRLLGPAVSARTPTGAGATTFRYPTNGSMLRDVAPRANVSGCASGSAPRTAASTVRSLSLFGGAVRATRVAATLVHSNPSGSSWHLRVLVKGLRIEGRVVSPRLDTPLAVGHWGRLLLDGAHVDRPSPSGLGWWRAGLDLRFVKAHAGLPAGTELLIAYVAMDRPFAVTPQQLKAPGKVLNAGAGAPLTVTPPLRGGPYVFPVAGDIGFTDTYGAARSDVPGGWHHGDDLFSGLGSPVLAVADGTVFSVGWNRLGGWRLWLRDRQGNEFYYAHLAGYTPLAHNGDHVTAGEPLAFVGNTGDAITTPHHLHFEVHPVSLLRLGYDGAVDPTTYLNTWKHLNHIAPVALARLPAGAARYGDGALSDYRQLLHTHGILLAQPKRAIPELSALLTRDGPLPALNVVPAVVARTRTATRQTALVAAFAAFFSVGALLLRIRLRARAP
jgi:Peptidase family M23